MQLAKNQKKRHARISAANLIRTSDDRLCKDLDGEEQEIELILRGEPWTMYKLK